jgi:hypothetical protein
MMMQIESRTQQQQEQSLERGVELQSAIAHLPFDTPTLRSRNVPEIRLAHRLAFQEVPAHMTQYIPFTLSARSHTAQTSI